VFYFKNELFLDCLALLGKAAERTCIESDLEMANIIPENLSKEST